MQKPFPTLTDLNLSFEYDRPVVVRSIPDLFLGGSTTRLRILKLKRIPFPRLPNLLLSATHLVHLGLYEIPDTRYIAPEVMVTYLSTLTRLEFLSLCFDQEDWKSFRPCSELERRRTSSSTRALLPRLTCFTFKNGASEYLGDIVDKIDAPLLDRLKIMFFHQPIFDTPRLAQFISCVPKLKTCNRVRMQLGSFRTFVKVLSLSKTAPNPSLLLEDIPSGFQLSHLVQLSSSLPQALILMVEGLIITGASSSDHDHGFGPSLWRELLQPFSAVKDLYLDSVTASRIAHALQEPVGESVSELLPVLQSIFLEELPAQPSGLDLEGIEQFVAARQLSTHPISVSRWEIKRTAALTW